MNMMADTERKLPVLSEEEERELLRLQRKRNITLAVILAVLVILIIIATIYMISTTGFVPMDNADLFRST